MHMSCMHFHSLSSAREDTLLPERVLFLETKEHPTFRTLLFGKEAVKTFLYQCSNSGKMNPLHRHSWEQSSRAVMLLQKKALDFCLENQSCDRRHIRISRVFATVMRPIVRNTECDPLVFTTPVGATHCFLQHLQLYQNPAD